MLSDLPLAWTPLILNIGSIQVLYLLLHSKAPIIWPSSKKTLKTAYSERRFFCCLEHVSHVKPPNLSPTLHHQQQHNAIGKFIRSAKVSISNAFAYFSILKLTYATLM